MEETKNESGKEDLDDLVDKEEKIDHLSLLKAQRGGHAFPSHLSYGTSEKSKFTTFLLLVVILIILGAGGVFAWRLFLPATPKQANPSLLASPAPAATQAPVKTLNRGEWTFEVLNGSQVTGEAKKVATQLTKMGYTVVKTGNADKSTYTKDELFIRAEKGDEADLVLADLKSDFKIASISGVLKEGTASARLIIGGK